VVVVDTGSVDRTMELARGLGARVFNFSWKNDFSAARNYALSKATKEWILILDADEVLEKGDFDKIKKLIEGVENSAMARGAVGYFCNQQVRLFPNRESIRFEGEVHENVERSLQAQGIPIFKTDIVVHHYGRIKFQEIHPLSGAR